MAADSEIVEIIAAYLKVRDETYGIVDDVSDEEREDSAKELLREIRDILPSFSARSPK